MHLRVGAGDRRVHDHDGTRADAVSPCDRRRVDDREAVVLETPVEAREVVGAVQQQAAALAQPLQHEIAEQGRVEHEQVIGVVDLVPIRDRLVSDAGVGTNRRTRALTRIVPEGLDALAQLRVDGGEDLRAGDATLAAAAM